ncbi:hypothetical protein ACSSS7_008417 [Eimeria intestinalis]
MKDEEDQKQQQQQDQQDQQQQQQQQQDQQQDQQQQQQDQDQQQDLAASSCCPRHPSADSTDQPACSSETTTAPSCSPDIEGDRERHMEKKKEKEKTDRQREERQRQRVLPTYRTQAKACPKAQTTPEGLGHVVLMLSLDSLTSKAAAATCLPDSEEESSSDTESLSSGVLPLGSIKATQHSNENPSCVVGVSSLQCYDGAPVCQATAASREGPLGGGGSRPAHLVSNHRRLKSGYIPYNPYGLSRLTRQLLELTELPFMILWIYFAYFLVIVALTAHKVKSRVWLSALVAGTLVGIGLNANAYRAIMYRGYPDVGIIVRFFLIPFGVSALSGLTHSLREQFLLVFPIDPVELLIAIAVPTVLQQQQQYPAGALSTAACAAVAAAPKSQGIEAFVGSSPCIRGVAGLLFARLLSLSSFLFVALAILLQAQLLRSFLGAATCHQIAHVYVLDISPSSSVFRASDVPKGSSSPLLQEAPYDGAPQKAPRKGPPHKQADPWGGPLEPAVVRARRGGAPL